MASIYDLKPRFQQWQRPLVTRLAGVGISANQITLAALLLSAAMGLLLYLWPTHTRLLLLLPIVLFVRMALNAMDGMLAREHAMQSDLSQMLNELGDRSEEHTSELQSRGHVVWRLLIAKKK